MNGITLWPFIIVSTPRPSASLMNHERIHIRQQAEWLILPFYLWYISEYYYHRLKGKSHHAAYRAISFEKEAYAFEEDLEYLSKRRFGAFLRFLK
ncbi:hypothetical protein [Siphonobacter sp. SORGH_AS_1065]|uniref:hypothetical protein n=1 Tax=Siphonobacter sp. SORGH_AS_1065 TaxID=3041795 RepID=UPI0027832466|nr:hypothetical protein [Siphonobacter sp. SORGH_AS_1065]MDQ1086531.1 hypothetical protein [Siphonobacter sp. SORGH_AS_1065]